MKSLAAGGAMALLCAAALVGCRDARPPAAASTSSGNHTAVLGGYGNGSQPAAAAPLTDAQGRPIPAPNPKAQLARSGPDGALGVWVQDGHVVASTYAPGTGWSNPQPLEDIYGEASDPRLASNGQGTAMVVWRHTVGNIQSLRYSRFDSAGWSVPDVMPGALPRPASEGTAAAPQLSMDAQGQAVAQWRSGFAPGEVQTARYTPGQGWTRALSEPVAQASPVSSGRPAPSSVQ